ncbi:MAG: hypothetical protein JJU18_12595, partial [Oceanicaulis sp.]|nr:hypothetical protein [Oceanicaulis sp.]
MTDAPDLFADPSAPARTARIVTQDGLPAALDALPEAARAHVRDSGFEGAPSQVVMLGSGAGAGG